MKQQRTWFKFDRPSLADKHDTAPFAGLLAELGEPDEAGYLAVLSEYK